MDHKRKEQIFKGILSLAGLAATIAVSPASPASPVFGIVQTLLGSLLPNWTAQFSMEALMPWVKDKWLSNPNPKINHHINRSLISGWRSALDQVLSEYKEEKGGLYGKEKETLPGFIKMLKDISEEEFLKNLHEDVDHDEIFKYLSADNAKISEYLDQRFDLDKKLDHFSDDFYLTREFIAHFKKRLPELMTFYFRADLKNGKEAKHAMDLLYHETIKEAVGQLSKRQEEQLSIISDIKNKVDKIPELDAFEKSCIINSSQRIREEIIQELTIIRENTIKIINLINVKPLLFDNNESGDPDAGTLFSYKQKYTDFAGRWEEQQLLQNFIDDNKKFCWMAITGPGGIGKSRLALEISEKARTQQFHSGFLDSSGSFNWLTWRPAIATFIVIDYAFADYQEVFNLIKIFRQKDKQQELDFKVRILLLDRELRADWQKEIRNNDAIRNSNFLKDFPEKFYKLNPLEQAHRWQIIKDIIHRSDLEEEKKNELLNAENEIINKLDTLDPKKRPLFAFFTGVALTQEGGLKKIENWNTNDLIKHHLERLEKGVWEKIDGYKGNEFAIKNFILVNTFCRELSSLEAGRVAEKFKIDPDYIRTKYSFTETVRNEYGRLEKSYGIQPDILGEYFIISMIDLIMSDPEKGQNEWLNLYQYCIELNAKGIFQTWALLNKDFNLVTADTLISLSNEKILDYDKLIRLSAGNYFYYAERGTLKNNIGAYEEALSDFNKSIEINSGNNVSYYGRGLAYFHLQELEKSNADFDIAIEMYKDWDILYKARGDVKYALKKYEDAIADYDKAIALNPDSDVSINARGNAKYSAGKYEEAAEDYSKAIELNPKNYIFLINRGQIYCELKRHEKALLDFGKAVELDQTNAIILNERGSVNYYLKNYKAAIADYTIAIGLDPSNNLYYNNRGNANNSLENYKEAIEDYTIAIGLDPKNDLSYRNRGNISYTLANYLDAIKDYTEAIKLNPDKASHYTDRGNASYSLQNYMEAIADYTTALNLDPDDMMCYSYRGNANNSLRNYEEAIADYTKAINLDQNNAPLYSNRATAKFELENHEDAIEDYTIAISLDISNALYYNLRGDAFFFFNDYIKALEDYNSAINLDPNNALYYYNGGEAQTKLNNYNKALEIFSIAIDLDPTNSLYYSSRGKAQCQVKNYEAGIKDCKVAIDLESTNSLYFYNSAEAKYMTGDYKEAITDYNSAIDLDPQIAYYYYHRANCYFDLKLQELAIADYNKVFDLDPKYTLLCYINVARARFEMGQYKEAVENYNQSIKIDPANSNYYHYRGLANRLAGNYEDAIKDYNITIQVEPLNDIAYTNRAVAKYFSNNYSLVEIISDLDKSIELIVDASKYLERGNINDHFGEFEEAVRDYGMAINLNSSDPVYYHNRGLVLCKIKNYENAVNDYDKALNLDPQNSKILYDRSNVKFLQCKYEEVIDDLVLAIKVNARFGEAYTLLGKTYAELNNKESAYESYHTAVELGDKNAEILLAEMVEKNND